MDKKGQKNQYGFFLKGDLWGKRGGFQAIYRRYQ